MIITVAILSQETKNVELNHKLCFWIVLNISMMTNSLDLEHKLPLKTLSELFRSFRVTENYLISRLIL